MHGAAGSCTEVAECGTNLPAVNIGVGLRPCSLHQVQCTLQRHPLHTASCRLLLVGNRSPTDLRLMLLQAVSVQFCKRGACPVWSCILLTFFLHQMMHCCVTDRLGVLHQQHHASERTGNMVDTQHTSCQLAVLFRVEVGIRCTFDVGSQH